MAQPAIHYAPETCAFCEGKSAEFWRGEEFHQRCPVCKGMGSLLVAQPARRCAFCNGEGAYFWRNKHHHYRCPVCHGAGWAHAQNKKK